MKLYSQVVEVQSQIVVSYLVLQGQFEAIQAYYDFFDYGQYEPEIDLENIVYGELE